MWDTIILGGNLQTDSEPFVGDVFYTTTTTCTEHKPFVGDVFLLIWEHLLKIASTTTSSSANELSFNLF